MASFDWSDYYKLAVRLSKDTEEASLRTAISRSYYYVFHLALTRAENNGYVPTRQGGSHRELWILYMSSRVPECRALAVIGLRMKDWRVTADYKANFPQLEATCRKVLLHAERFALGLNKLDPREP
jgi:uncharacterized protein (UPF0332 family)